MSILNRPPNSQISLKTLITFSQKLGFHINKCYLLWDFNINLFFDKREISSNKSYRTNDKNLPSLTKGYLNFCFSFYLKQLIYVPTRVTCKTTTLIDHVLTNSPQEVSQCDVIELGISDHDLVYCTRKTSLLKLNKHNEISIRSLKNYTKEKFLELIRKIDFPDYTTYTCLNNASHDFTFKLSEVIDLLCPSKKLRLKAGSKTWTDSKIISAIRKRYNLFKKIQKIWFRERKIIFYQQKWLLRKLYLRKKNLIFKK